MGHLEHTDLQPQKYRKLKALFSKKNQREPCLLMVAGQNTLKTKCPKHIQQLLA